MQNSCSARTRTHALERGKTLALAFVCGWFCDVIFVFSNGVKYSLFLGLSICYLLYLKGLLNKIGGGNGEMLFLYACFFVGKKFIVSLHSKGKYWRVLKGKLLR